MHNFIKLALMIFSVFVFSSLNNKSYAVTAESVKECSTDTHLFTGSATACRFTPQLYKAAVFEMGLCTANPMSGASLDKSTCTTVFTATDQTNGSLHDFALGDVELIGTSTRPANGTYTYPYIILKNTFTIKAEYERGGTTYYVKKSGSACDAVSTTSPAEECTDSLTQFNQAGNCDGEYLGARFSGGSLNGYLMRASDLDKRDGVADDDGSGGCSNVDRLVGVMELDTPVVISPSTISFKFTFNVTGYGAQMFTGAGRPNNNPNGGGGSGPFSGFFTIVDAPQQ
tara:strand:+ start:296 stop:1150 length:855 start_codon:yes stop_codon:yes gene_type:complete